MSSGRRFNISQFSDEDRRYVESILLDVRNRGDEALLDYTSRSKPFDNVKLSKDMLRVGEEELEESEKNVPAEVRKAVSFMMKRISKIVKTQMKMFSHLSLRDNGFEYNMRFYPIEKIGVLAPGGMASYVSSLVMAAYPAVLLGVKDICVFTPPRPDGSVNPVILYAAKLMSLKKVYRCNMVAGVGALAFGTESVPRVYKIFGAGNRFVILAKMIVNSYGVAIDIPAGPSELVVLADSSADPNLIALDLAAQAEHLQSFTALVTESNNVASSVKEIIGRLSKKYGLKLEMDIHIVKSLEEGVEICNSLAPEHLSLYVREPRKLVRRLTVAGTVFIGGTSPTAVGDYASGSIHILPTGEYARIRGGLTVLDYLRIVSYQKFSPKFLKLVQKHVKILSLVEGLPLHGLSVDARLEEVDL
ncbi:MAG: histidinol dehydrogenase [Thermoproteota archaeon]